MATAIEATNKPPVHPGVVRAGQNLLANALRRPARPYAQFAEDELILPRGPYRGQRFRGRRFPAAGLWFAELDARRWQYHVATGPTQSGKTLCCFIIPILYCLFERHEDVIVGLPHLDMAQDKWSKDIKPAIEKTRYSKWLPTTGEGSKGGKIRSVRFDHGPTLTFMSFQGDDKSRAGDTAPNLIITETDAGTEGASTSVEDSPISQLVQRVGAFDLDAFIVMECTVSTTRGETWQRYTNGSKSKLVRPCPKCGLYVTPEREHFRGWLGAQNEIQAGDAAAWHCPECGEPWTDNERYRANAQSVLLHKGQDIDRQGRVSGPLPQTDTLGFRWSAIDNPFRSARNLGRMEYKATRALDQETAQKGLDQFQYAKPWVPPEDDAEPLDPYEAASRWHPFGEGGTARGVVPAETEAMTVGVDLRKRELHWSAWAWRMDGTPRVIDYNIVKVFSDRIGEEKAIMAALRYMRENVVAAGFPVEDSDQVRIPEQVWIDAGWRSYVVYQFVAECDASEEWEGVFRPYVGRGAGKQYRRPYRERTSRSKSVPVVGDNFYFSWQTTNDPPVLLVIVNADHWKGFVHARFQTPTVDDAGDRQAGAATLFTPRGGDHTEFTRHLAAEYPERLFVPGQGEVMIWKTISRVNHYLDTSMAACAAASWLGVEVAPANLVEIQTEGDERVADDLTTPDGRQFYV